MKHHYWTLPIAGYVAFRVGQAWTSGFFCGLWVSELISVAVNWIWDWQKKRRGR